MLLIHSISLTMHNHVTLYKVVFLIFVCSSVDNLDNIILTKRYFLYSAVSSPLDRSKRFTLFASPGRPVNSDTNSASPGSILALEAAITRQG